MSEGQKLIVGTRKGLFTVERLGGGWDVTRVDFLGDNVSMAFSDPRDGSMIAALEHGHFGAKVHRSGDGGATWAEVGVPAYPEPPEGEPASKLMKVWALEAGVGGSLWCGTIPGGLFRSEDGGQTWGLVGSLWDHPKRKEWFGGGADQPGIHSVCVDPRDPNRVVVGVSCGGAWMTPDNGETWECRATGMWAAYMPPDRKDDPAVQDPHRVVQCPAAPDHFWAQHHNGIFRSTDGAASWREVTDVPPSSFGFAVAVHPTDPETAWFVPGTSDEKRVPVNGRLVVTRTRDGGRTFDVLTEGLPAAHSYDLVYRHALDVNGDGRCLAFGSTTGALWVTENGGDAWRCVSAHLPPIHCVRFAA